ncbi:MAG: methyltransferase domain-containing protein, partial [Nitrospirae bacterium]
MRLETTTTLKCPTLHRIERDGLAVVVDPEGPNWAATDRRGADLLAQLATGATLMELAEGYRKRHALEPVKAWHHVETVVRDAVRHGLARAGEPEPRPYAGRAAHLEGAALEELWLHPTNACNLACRHCLVSSGPDGERGLPTEAWRRVIGEARALGTRRFYVTGGEPLLRPDLPELLALCLEDPEAEVALLTNGIPLRGERLARLGALDRERIRIQVSVDGASAATCDALRGPGSFDGALEGIRNAVAAGFHCTLTTVITRDNAREVAEVTRLAGRLGVGRHHLLWCHRRGRAGDALAPPVAEVIAAVRAAVAAGREAGVVVDNLEAVKERLNYPAGTRRDLSNACVTSLCVYADGRVFPSASLAGVEALCLGSILERPLEELWRHSPVARAFREASVAEKPGCRGCPYRFLCGGGDVEHAWVAGGSPLADDPYCELHQAMIEDALFERARERAALHTNGRSGYDAPLLFTAMGEGSIHCASGEPLPEVVVSHSECVVSFDLDAPRAKVREFYGEAAASPQEELCCPVQPDPAEIDHIPQEVIDRFYGCGSPVGAAAIQPGETTLDLGSGAGIDVFTAARKVGPGGRAIGVDMTDEMLAVARRVQPQVAERLGYDVVDFRKGYLEQIPVADRSVDVVTSNCVVNLSPDKKRVFAEVWRVLKDHGRLVFSDIVAEEQVPPEQRRDPRLWGECISGALTEEELLAYLERAGFYGIEILSRSFWKEVEGYRFFSVTARAYKFEKRKGCVFAGQQATYVGPYKGVADEEGHYFPRGVPVEVC